MTEVTTAKENLPAEIGLDAFGDAGISSQDIVIPKILVMQGLSKQVTEGKAKLGDFVDSLSSEVIGDISTPIEFIPFHLEKKWIISKKRAGDNRFKFDRFEDLTAMNENRSWEGMEDGVETKYEKLFNFYSLLTNDMALPYIISFKSTSMKAGRELATQMFVKNRAANKVPPAKVMNLFGDRVTKNDNTFAVLKTAVQRDSTPEEIQQCLMWYKTIASGGTKSDNSDIAPPSDEPTPQF